MAAGRDGSTEGAAPGRFRILSDAPALDGPDPLDFEEMARGLERIIIASRPSTPFTVSIEAGWGAGKSTLMRRLERRLRAPSPSDDADVARADVRTVWFNAWTAPPGTVLEGLVRSVLDEVDAKLVRRAARKKHLLTGLGAGASVAAGLLGFGNVADRLWAKTSEDPKQRNQLNGFVREAMDMWLQKGAHRNTDRLIVVFVDDLDRCSPPTVMQVFEAVKLYLDAPGLVFVLGWDTEQVIRAVSTGQATEERIASRYVEKIVQFGFRIRPPNTPQLNKLADHLCQTAGLTQDVLDERHRDLLISTTNGNPRQMKRFLNRFVLLYDLTNRGPVAAVDSEVLILLLVLQASYDGFYRLLTGTTNDTDGDNPLFEFSDYVTVRRALSRRDIDQQESDIVQRYGYSFESGDSTAVFEAFERDRPREFPNLAADRQFVSLVEAMSDGTKRQLQSLARSAELDVLQSTESASDLTPAGIGSDQYGDRPRPGAAVLWVDDVPKRTDHQHLPPDVDLIVATSGDEARRVLASRPVDLLISDIGREGSPSAGLVDLALFRSENLYDGPAIFYTTRPTTRHVEEASKLGADVTADPSQLAGLVRRYLPPESPRGTEKVVRPTSAAP